MNYYIVTEEIFDTLTKENISYMLKSLDNTKRLIATTDTVSNNVNEFNDIDSCSNYTFTNHSDWVGDGTGVEEWEFDNIEYVPLIDE
jgi:hypothetical protein